MSHGLGQQWDLLVLLVAKELKLRYRGTLLGVFWSLANPLALAAVLYFALHRILRIEIDNYPLFILSALFAWQWLSNSMTSAASLFHTNAQLLRKASFPRSLLCIAAVMGDAIHFLATIPVYAALALASGVFPTWEWCVGIPLLFVFQTVLILGAVMAVSTATVLLPDTEQLVRIGLLLLFYLTPILYPLSMVPEPLRPVILLNPAAVLVIAWRALLLDGALSPYLALAGIYAVLGAGTGIVCYRSVRWRLAELV